MVASSKRALAGALAFALIVTIGALPTPTAAAAKAPKGTWSQANKRKGPPARDRHSMAYDAARGELVMFGGINSKGNTPGTWLFKDGIWRQASPEVSPTLRTGAAMTYDSIREEIVLFGGHTPAGRVGETWTWDGFNWHLETPSTSPPGRSFASLAFDERRGETVMFGGLLAGGGSGGDTWTWDGDKWTLQTPAMAPPPRDTATMAYDSDRGEVVLFGGYGTGGPSNDTWTWDGETWNAELPATSPPARTSAGMTYDAARAEIVLFGGMDRVSTRNDTWTWNGHTWSEKSAGPAPQRRSSHALAYSASEQRTVLFGGDSTNLQRADTWVWDGSGWSSLDEATPEARFDMEAVYDAKRGNVVMFGGDANEGKVADTWTWDGQWARRDVAGPSARSMYGMVYDSARDEVVVFGGYGSGGTELNDTWVWDGSAWTKRDTPIAPPPRHNHVMFYDSARDETILWGGSNSQLGLILDDTWVWDGTSWEPRRPDTSPGPRAAASAAYDPIRKQGVLFGGYAQGSSGLDYTSTTWIWTGETWYEHFGMQTPAGRAGASMTYDSAAKRVLLFGGNEGLGNHLADLWAWNAAGWTRIEAEGPDPRWGAALAHHTGSKKTLLFGGNSNNFQDDTWTFEAASAPSVTPAVEPKELWTRPGLRSIRDLAMVDLGGRQGRELVLASNGVAALHEDGLRSGRYHWAHKWKDRDDPMRGGDLDVAYDIVTTDANDDGVPDTVAGGEEGVVAVDGKNGELLWEVQLDDAIPSVQHVAAADYNADGIRDIVFSGYMDEQVYALDGRTGEYLWRSVKASGYTHALETADLNGDGAADVVTVGHSPSGPSVNAFSGLRAAETGIAAPMWSGTTTNNDPNTIAIGQVVSGGPLEVVIGDYTGEAMVFDGATGAVISRWTVPGRMSDIALVNADTDADLEIATASGYNDDNGESTALGVYQSSGLPVWTYDAPVPPLALEAADVDADGDQDLVYGGGYYEFRGRAATDGIVEAIDPLASSMQQGAPKILWSREIPTFVELVEHGEVFGQDALIVGERYEGWIRALNLDGSQQWVHRTGSGIAALGSADVNGDGRLEVIEGDDAGGVAVHDRNGDTLWRARIHRQASPDIASVAGGDVTGDGRAEVFAGTFEYTRDGAGYLHAFGPDGDQMWTDRLSGPAGDILVRDLDGVGTTDIVAGATGQGLGGGGAELVRYDGNGNAVWRAPTPPSTFGMLVQPAPLNDDGVEDLVVGTLPFGISYIVGYDGATGTELWRYRTPANLQWMDVLPDRSDGIVAGDIGGNVYKLTTEGAEVWRAEMGAPSRQGVWGPDVDGDGLRDAATTTGSGSVFMLRGSDGQELWEAPLDGEDEWPYRIALVEGKDHSYLAAGTFSSMLSVRGGTYLLDPESGGRTGKIASEGHIMHIETADLTGDGSDEAIVADGSIMRTIELFGDRPEPDPDPTPTESPTPSPSVTASPFPTSSPAPTPTSSPDPSPEPTTTPTPEPSTDPGSHETYRASGHILVSNPTSVQVSGITETEFTAACAIPSSQGVDGYVFEVPGPFGMGTATAAITGSNALDLYDLDAYFFTRDCDPMDGPLSSAAPDEQGPVPAGAAYAVVNQFVGADTDVELVLTGPRGNEGTGEPSPAPSAGDRPKPTPWASPTPTTGPTPTPSPTVAPVARGRSAVTLRAERRSVRFGEFVKLAGIASGDGACNVDQVLVQRRNGSRWKTLEEVTVAYNGIWSTRFAGRRNARYRAVVAETQVCESSRSEASRVSVRVKLKVAKRQGCGELRGSVRPRHPSTLVLLQTKKNRRWRTIDRDRLDRRSSFTLRPGGCERKLRVVWPTQGSHNTRAQIKL